MLAPSSDIPSGNSTYHAALVLRIGRAISADWEAIALFENIGAAEDYAEMCDTYAEDFRYISAKVACAPQDLFPIEGELPLFRRTFPREMFAFTARRPRANASTAESVQPGEMLRASS